MPRDKTFWLVVESANWKWRRARTAHGVAGDGLAAHVDGEFLGNELRKLRIDIGIPIGKKDEEKKGRVGGRKVVREEGGKEIWRYMRYPVLQGAWVASTYMPAPVPKSHEASSPGYPRPPARERRGEEGKEHKRPKKNRKQQERDGFMPPIYKCFG